MKKLLGAGFLLLLAVMSAAALFAQRPATKPPVGLPVLADGPRLKPSTEYLEIDRKLASLAAPLPKPGSNDWLSRHEEHGETFEQYLRREPLRKGPKSRKIYVCLIGDFSPKQQEVLDTTLKYLERFFTVPVEIHERLPLEKIPAAAQRVHPTWGGKQLFTRYVLNEVLKPRKPADATAYLAFTAMDLFPDPDWNFVYGQASLSERVGVWSMHRNGDPAESDAAYRLCLERTMRVAGHETGHILGLVHCIAHHCNMNGANHQRESDSQPMHYCPVCLRKLCWNLQVEPGAYLQGLEDFYRELKWEDEADYYRRAKAALDDRPEKK